MTNSGFGGDPLSIWNPTTGERLVVLRGYEHAITSVAFSPDGTRIVTASWDKRARIWDPATGEQLVVLNGHQDGVKSASFSPDGTRIVTASRDNTARIWNTATGEQLTVLRGHENGVESASFSPDGTRIVTASRDKTARIWDAGTGEQLATLGGHEDGLSSASFNADGTRIVTASRDNTVRIWDAATAEQLIVLRGHEVSVLSASFSPDGTRIVTGHNTTIRIWDGIPHAQRYRQKQALKDAEPKAARVLDIVMATAPQQDGIPDLRAVAESIRTDPAIDEAVRHVAINLLMGRANRIGSKANDLIDDLKAHLVFVADIREAVQAAPSLEPAVRAAAVNMARWIEDSPERLYYWARFIVDDDDRSRSDYEQAQRAAASAFESTDPTSLNFARTLAKAWTRLQQPDKVVEVWREHLDKLRKDTTADGWELASWLIEYGMALLKNDQANDAEPVLRECLTIGEKARKKDRWWIAEARRLLGECLTMQGADPSLALGARIEKLCEAETILIELGNAVVGDSTSSEDDKTEAIQRVVDLYEAWHAAEPDQGYDAKADEWRATLPPRASDRGGDD